MISTCTRKLALRWAVLAMVIAQAVYGGIWWISGILPTVSRYYVMDPDDLRELPVELPRFVDGLFLMVPVAIAAWIFFDFPKIYKRWIQGSPEYDAHGWQPGVCVAVVIGVCGSYILSSGLLVLLIGAALGGIVFTIWGAVVGLKSASSFGLALIAGLTVWLIMTAITGIIIGTSAAALCVAVSAITHFLPVGIYRLFTTEHFSRQSKSMIDFMTTCNVSDQH